MITTTDGMIIGDDVLEEIKKGTAAHPFPTPENMLESVPSEAAIRQRLYTRFSPIEKNLDPEEQADLDYFITLTAHEWDSALSVIQTTYQKLLVRMKENCAKAVCPMCDKGDPRATENGHEVHTVKVTNWVRSTADKQSYVYVKSRCGANSIWSMK